MASWLLPRWKPTAGRDETTKFPNPALGP